jgi:hypothetical protein
MPFGKDCWIGFLKGKSESASWGACGRQDDGRERQVVGAVGAPGPARPERPWRGSGSSTSAYPRAWRATVPFGRRRVLYIEHHDGKPHFRGRTRT